MEVEIRRGVALTSGATLWTWTAGAGPPVVLIHGNFVSSEMWEAQVPALAAEFTVVAYDVRGFGRSPLVSGRYSDSGDLRALLDALDIDAPHLIGMSMGGSIALDYAITYPDRVRSLVIVPGGIGGWEPPAWMQEGWPAYQKAVAAGDFEGARNVIMHFPPSLPLRRRPSVQRRVIEMIDQHRWTDPWDSVDEDILEPPAAQRLPQVRVPTLLLSGELDDPALLALGEQMALEMPYAERVVLRDAGHMVNMETPEAFNQAVIAFLRKHEVFEPGGLPPLA